jgi:hypothetical protein
MTLEEELKSTSHTIFFLHSVSVCCLLETCLR